MNRDYSKVPIELVNLQQWVCWGWNGMPLKMPINPLTGSGAKAGQADTWGTFAQALDHAEHGDCSGIGFEFSNGGLVGVDLDHCITNGGLSPEAAELVQQFNSYTEVSQSGTGLHIICKGKLSGKAIKSKTVEMYDSGRYFALTGEVYNNMTVLLGAQPAIDSLYGELTAARAKTQEKPTPNGGLTLDDSKLIEIAANARNGTLFTDLFTGKWESHYGSQSEADLALCNMLAFYTGKDVQQMDRLFRQSGLTREKWDRQQSGTTYGAITIQNAIGHCTKVFDPRTTAEQDFGDVFGRQHPKEQKHKFSIISAEELQKKDLPPIRYVVVGMFPQGLSLLASPPKYGKSWFVLDLCLSVAAGTLFMNHRTVKSGCLYLALEDSERRLQDRMNKILAGADAPKHFDYATSALDIGQGLIEQLDDYIAQKPETGLIVIDTLQKVRAPGSGRENAYSADYREVGALKKFADKYGICLVLVHHLRKMADDTDAFNRISGTNGIMGAADTALVMTRAKRTDTQTTLSITGRDVESSETVIEFSKDDYKWHVVGNADWIAEQRARLAYDHSPIVQTIKKLLEQSPGGWSGSMQELLDAGKHFAGTYLAETSRALTSKVKALEKPLFDYDGIVHERAKNGNGGSKHHFYFSTVDNEPTYEEALSVFPSIN